MFSLTRTGSLVFDTEIDLAALPAYLGHHLRRVDASHVKIQGNRVAFTGGIFRLVNNWNVLVPFGSGDLTVDGNSHTIHYRVSVRQFIVVVTIMLILGSLFVVLTSSPWQTLLLMPLGWLWMVGANLIIGVARFERFVGRLIATAPRLVRHDEQRSADCGSVAQPSAPPRPSAER
jgi:hypothetical protein